MWWKEGVIYHVYPRSFMDANGDGVGDLRGIVARLEHLARLGVDALWLSPVYPSPMADFGYDVADYCDIDPLFGSLEDMDRLIAEAHARGLRVIMDFVPNHTSVRHPWFIESRASRTSPKRDWYIWRDPAAGGGPPNNWPSEFGGPAWTFDEPTGQYYLHSYLREQPDLNWRHSGVVAAMHDVLRFWLDRGVDGFRLDALSHLIKEDGLPDNPPNPAWKPEQGPYKRLLALHNANRPEIHATIAGLRRVVDEYPDRVMIGELYLPNAELMRYYGANGDEVQLPTNFVLLKLPWRAQPVADAIVAYESGLPAGAWPNWVLGNHDKHRVASRIGRDQARVAAMLLLTLRGTPTIYYGDELGVIDSEIPPERVQDPWEKNVPGLGLGRDPARAPMPWDDTPGGGFTTGTPWLPFAADQAVVNVAAEERDPQSTLALHRQLLALRRAEPALTLGSIEVLPVQGDVLHYRRVAPDGRTLEIALNLANAPATVERGDSAGRVLISTFLDREGDAVNRRLTLRKDEGLVVDTSA